VDFFNAITNVPAGYVYTSSDYGVHWAAQLASVPSTYSYLKWGAIASSQNGNMLAVVSYGSVGTTTTMSSDVYTSTDAGVTWTQSSYDFAGVLRDVASSADGSRLIVASYNGFLLIYFSKFL
jgi:photosystem II stability/assembly factor-like uncharacterized protein